jgi:hypothetical protein
MLMRNEESRRTDDQPVLCNPQVLPSLLQVGIKTEIIVRFAPNDWGEVERFQQFFKRAANLSNADREALSGVANHFHKAVHLLNVARTIAPNLQEEQKELEERGFTSGRRAAEFTSVVESALTALYSSVDCTRRILKTLYPKAQGLPESTRKLFQNAADGKIDLTIPEGIRYALSNAEWFRPLRIVRDALTHTNTGCCSLDRGTGAVRYFHDAFKPICDRTYIDDLMEFVANLRDCLNRFLGCVFRELNRSLEDIETQQMCGIFYGRIYHRFVRPSEAIDFHSGRCGAYEWFELEEHPTCPFVDSCGAYKRRKLA